MILVKNRPLLPYAKMPRILGTDPNVYLEAERKKEFDNYYSKKVVEVKSSIKRDPPK